MSAAGSSHDGARSVKKISRWDFTSLQETQPVLASATPRSLTHLPGRLLPPSLSTRHSPRRLAPRFLLAPWTSRFHPSLSHPRGPLMLVVLGTLRLKESRELYVSHSCIVKTRCSTCARQPCSRGRMTRKQVQAHCSGVIYGTFMSHCPMIARAPWPSCATPTPIAPGHTIPLWPRLKLWRILRFRASAVADVAPHGAPSARCALPGSWNGQALLELATPGHTFTLAPMESDVRPWQTRGRQQPLAQRDRAHSGALQPSVSGKAPSATRGGSSLAFLTLATPAVLSRFARLLNAWSGPWAASPVTAQHLPWLAHLVSPGRPWLPNRERESRSATSSRTHVSFKQPERWHRRIQGFGDWLVTYLYICHRSKVSALWWGLFSNHDI